MFRQLGKRFRIKSREDARSLYGLLAPLRCEFRIMVTQLLH